jgi:hypothetical protein
VAAVTTRESGRPAAAVDATPTSPILPLVGALLAALAACQTPDTTSADPLPGPLEPLRSYRACPQETRVGEVRIELGERATAVSGQIAAGVVPVQVREVVAEASGCRLLRRRQLFCDPPCAPDSTCGDNGRCLPYPDNLDAGTITVAGLARAVKMRPDPTGRRYWDTTLPHPGFHPGATIRLWASGAQLPPFSLGGFGVSPLTVDDRLLTLAPQQPLPLTWTAAAPPASAAPAPTRIDITLAIDQHGVTPMILVCDTEDTGRFEIPAPVISTLLAAGYSGYPSLQLSRQSADSLDLPPGCVELIVSSAAPANLTVQGHRPCRTDADCTGTPPSHCLVARQTSASDSGAR